MKQMKNKFKSYSFWMSVCASVVLVLNNFGRAFGFSFDNEIFTSIVDSICGVLIVFGILTMSKENENINKKDDENIEIRQKNQQEIDDKNDKLQQK